MAAERISDVMSDGHQGSPSLVDVLSKRAAYWVLCECGLQFGVKGPDGWEEKGLRLEHEIDFLNAHIPLLDSPSRKAAMKADLVTLETQSKALNEEWGQAIEETEAYSELLCEARKFCMRRFGIGDNELFIAALVGFNPERLQPGQGPSKHRMTELAMLLSNLNRAEWESQRWANPTRPTMRTTKRVAPDRLNSFIVQHLKQVADQDHPASPIWLSPRSVADLARKTGCSRTTLNSEIKNGTIPGGAKRENDRPRGNVILQQSGLDYLKRKGGKYK